MENKTYSTGARQKPDTCIIFTRANHDSRDSLTYQLEKCKRFASDLGLQVLQHFEGYAGDTKRQYERMIAFAKQNAPGLKYVVCSSFDRFSRVTTEALAAIAELRENFGIRVLAADLGPNLNDSTYEEFVTNLSLLIAKLDGSIRRDTIIAGKRRRALQGSWAGVPPRGYEVTGSGKKMRLILTPEAELIREAFVKRSEGTSVPLLRDWLRGKGFFIGNSPLHRLLRNCFYAGYIKSVYLPGQLINGTHPPIIDPGTFFLINKIDQENDSTENQNS